MPNRILKESICTSESIDSLTEFQEVFFYRLLVNCDDFGRFDARPKILSSRLFPLRPIAIEMIENAIAALVREQMITLYSVDGKDYLQVNAWLNHQQKRANKSKFPSPSEGSIVATDIDQKAFDNFCNQLISDDSKCPRESRIENREYENRESSSIFELDDADAHQHQQEQNRVLNAAEDAGFKMSNDVRASLIALYADSGLEKVLDGLKSCSEHGAANLAYLRAVLRGTPKRRKPQVNAQDFEQRDYSEVPGQMMNDLANEIEAMRRNEA